MGQTINVPKFEKNQEIVKNANQLQKTVDDFFSEVENAVGSIQDQIKKATKYAGTIADLYQKLSAFKEPLNNLINNRNFPESVISGAKDVKDQLDTVLADLESEYQRAADFVNSSGGSGGSSGSGGGTAQTQSSALPSFDRLTSGGLSGGRGMGQTFEKNEELVQSAKSLLMDLQQFEELTPNPGGGVDLRKTNEASTGGGIGITTLLGGAAAAYALSQYMD